MPSPSIADLRYSFWGGGTDAEYAALLAAYNEGLDGVDLLTQHKKLWVSASTLASISTGVPTRSLFAARWDSWLLDGATSEGVTGNVLLPSDWNTCHVDFYWSNAGAGAGDVRWQIQMDSAADTESLAVSGATTVLVATAPAQNVLKVTRVESGRAVTPGELATVRPARRGEDGTDTLTNDVALLGILLTRAS